MLSLAESCAQSQEIKQQRYTEKKIEPVAVDDLAGNRTGASRPCHRNDADREQNVKDDQDDEPDGLKRR